MGGNGLIVRFGEVMPMCLGRLQRQSRRAFWASGAPEVSTSELAGWCWARQTLMEKRALSRWQRKSMIRAARSIGAVRTRRIGREWLWRLPDAVAIQGSTTLAACCIRGAPALGAPLLADVLAAPGRGVAGLHGTLDSPRLEVRTRLLHAVLPVALRLGGDPGLRRAGWDRVQPWPLARPPSSKSTKPTPKIGCRIVAAPG
jgi:hypothetical protein